MAPTTNEALVRRFTGQVWNQRNLTIVDELVAGDAVLHDLTGRSSSTATASSRAGPRPAPTRAT